MSKPSIIIVNDQLADTISAQDRGFFYGDGVFETMWLSQGNIPLWKYHYERMASGLGRLGIALDEAILKQHMTVMLSAIMSTGLSDSDGVWKLIVTRGEGGRGYQEVDDMKATLVSYFYPQNVENLKKNTKAQMMGVAVDICQTRLPVNPLLAGIKSLNQLPYVMASNELRERQSQEGLLLSENNRLIEATSKNIFIIKGGELFTPDLCETGVAGTMRRLIIERIATSLGAPVQELFMVPKNLDNADEVFLCNSVTGIWPVISCEERAWSVGGLTLTIQDAVNSFMESDVTLSLRNNFL